MNHTSEEPRALFPAPDGNTYPDTLVCSGKLPGDAEAAPCPFSDGGRMPIPRPLDPAAPGYAAGRGEPGDLCPPCARQQLGLADNWQGHGGRRVPPELAGLRLFKCRMLLLLVVPGLYEATPKRMVDARGG